MYPQRREKCRQGIHLANILPRRASFPVRSPQIMRNGQILPLICDSAFCAEGGGGARPALWFWGIGALRPPSRGSASVVNLNRRCEHRGAHPETQAHGRVLPVGKPCINPQARAPWGPPGCKLMGPTRRRKHHGTQPEVQALRSPFMGCKRCGSFFVRECQSGNESYRAGKAITNTAPPSGALNAVTVPSKLSTISFTMAKPRPAPPLLRAREASLR